MHYLIKIIFFILISHKAISNENNKNEVLFKINNKVFTNIDLEKRIDYVALINNLITSELSKSDKEEITEDYISSLIFYEYYIKNNIFFQNLDNELNLTNENFINNGQLNELEIKDLKFNSRIDLIRNKIIEEFLNSKKNSLLKQVNTLDLLYNYNLQYIIIKESLLNEEILNNIKDRNSFNNLNKFLNENKYDYLYKEEEIIDYNIISNKIKKIINQDIPIYKNYENGYVNLISIKKSLESYEGIFVKLISFNTNKPFENKKLKCNNLNKTIDINKTVYKEYEYSKLNNNIKNNLKTINDYILFKDNDNYNYIVLCDLTYDEKLLKNINFNKKINSLVKKIQINFLKIYKDEYKFVKIK